MHDVLVRLQDQFKERGKFDYDLSEYLPERLDTRFGSGTRRGSEDFGAHTASFSEDGLWREGLIFDGEKRARERGDKQFIDVIDENEELKYESEITFKDTRTYRVRTRREITSNDLEQKRISEFGEDNNPNGHVKTFENQASIEGKLS